MVPVGKGQLYVTSEVSLSPSPEVLSAGEVGLPGMFSAAVVNAYCFGNSSRGYGVSVQ